MLITGVSLTFALFLAHRPRMMRNNRNRDHWRECHHGYAKLTSHCCAKWTLQCYSVSEGVFDAVVWGLDWRGSPKVVLNKVASFGKCLSVAIAAHVVVVPCTLGKFMPFSFSSYIVVY